MDPEGEFNLQRYDFEEIRRIYASFEEAQWRTVTVAAGGTGGCGGSGSGGNGSGGGGSGGPSNPEDEFYLWYYTVEEFCSFTAAFDEMQSATVTATVVGTGGGSRSGGNRNGGGSSDGPSNVEELINAELVKLQARGFLKVSFVKKAIQTTPLTKKGKFVREIISKFIEEGEAEFARLRAAIENKNTFEFISVATIGIRKTAHRIGARDLWSLAEAYVEDSKSDNRHSRRELLPKYEVMKEEFDKIKNDFRATLLQYAHAAEARLVDDPPVPPTDPSAAGPSSHCSRG